MSSPVIRELKFEDEEGEIPVSFLCLHCDGKLLSSGARGQKGIKEEGYFSWVSFHFEVLVAF